MRYFTIITHDHWIAKNKLHADVLRIAHERNKFILKDLAAVKNFCNELSDLISLKNQHHQRLIVL